MDNRLFVHLKTAAIGGAIGLAFAYVAVMANLSLPVLIMMLVGGSAVAGYLYEQYEHKKAEKAWEEAFEKNWEEAWEKAKKKLEEENK